MKRWIIIQIVAVVLWLPSGNLHAQISFHSISANFGLIDAFHAGSEFNPGASPLSFSDNKSMFYPELEVNAEIMAPFLRGGLYWGYWTEKALENNFRSAGFIDTHTYSYSYSSHIAGARLTFLPGKLFEDILLPFGVFAGMAQHFISSKCYDNRDAFSQLPGETYTCENTLAFQNSDGQRITTLEAGLSTEIRIYGPIQLQGKLFRYFPVGSSDELRYRNNRWVYSAGLSILF